MKTKNHSLFAEPQKRLAAGGNADLLHSVQKVVTLTAQHGAGRLCAALFTGLLALAALPARADQQSFNATNVVNPAISIVTDPTNAPGLQTGAGIRVDNYRELGFYMSGDNVNTSNSIITAGVIRAGTGGSPVITTNSRSYETTTAFTITYTTPAAAGPWYFYTNLDSTHVGACGWVGLNSLTNAQTGASTTNFDCGVVKKIIPIRYP